MSASPSNSMPHFRSFSITVSTSLFGATVASIRIRTKKNAIEAITPFGHFSSSISAIDQELPDRLRDICCFAPQDDIIRCRGVAVAREDLEDVAEHHPEPNKVADALRSEEHTSELQSLMRISSAVFCLKQKKAHKKR